MNTSTVNLGLGFSINKPGFAHLQIGFDLFSAFCGKCLHIKIDSKSGLVFDPVPKLFEFRTQKYGFIQSYLLLVVTVLDIEIAGNFLEHRSNLRGLFFELLRQFQLTTFQGSLQGALHFARMDRTRSNSS